MQKFPKSDGFQMKRGSKPDFKSLGSSPTKVIPQAMTGAAGAAAGIGTAGLAAMGGGLLAAPIGLALKRRLDGTAAAEKKFEDVLESEGLKRNFWGKLGFGGRRSRERKQRIKELQAQEKEGIDRERIEASTGAPVAGPGS